MRAYEKSHPWLSFTLDTQRFSPATWALLGEARSKCEHLAGVPLRPTTAQRLHTVSLVRGAHATAAIEGNTLTVDEVARIERKELDVPKSRTYQQAEVENVLAVLDELWDRLRDEPRLDVDERAIRAWNERLLRGRSDELVRPGEYRLHSVEVNRYLGAPAADLDFLMKRLCAWLLELDANTQLREMLGRGGTSILVAVVAHLYLAWIHPFGDGNGRTARMLELALMARAGIPSIAVHLLSNHYNVTRDRYYASLDRASKDPDAARGVAAFVHYAVEGFVDQLREAIQEVRGEQIDIAWRNYVHEMFRDAGKVEKRQRDLLLDLSTGGDVWVPIDRATLGTTRTARTYARLSRLTLDRDIEALRKRGLLEVDRTTRPGRLRAHRAIVLAFLPDAVGK